MWKEKLGIALEFYNLIVLSGQKVEYMGKE